MERAYVRVLFVVILAFLPFQFVYARLISEPYPAVVLPGFGGSAKPGEYVVRTEPKLYAEFVDGERKEIEVEDLFWYLPSPQIPVRLRKFVPAGESGRKSADSGAHSGTLKSTLLVVVEPFEVEPPKPPLARKSPEIRAWFGDNLAARFGRRPKMLEVIWTRKTIRRGTWEVKTSQQLSRVELDLRPDVGE